MTNSADPDQLASSEANWSGSTLFAKAEYIQVEQDKGNCKLNQQYTWIIYSKPNLFACPFFFAQVHFDEVSNRIIHIVFSIFKVWKVHRLQNHILHSC